jgi:SpoVK/Ycf46/Vps4 family AAA+-type ATPase
VRRRPQETQAELDAFGDLLLPQEAVEPILPPPVRASLTEWLTEIWAADELAEIGLTPRRKAIFYGAPGTGKTTLAHHLAARLGLPMLAIRPDRIVDCWLGSTGRNLGALFDAARPAPDGEGPVVLFFDEFEALASKRVAGARDAQMERNAVIDTLLQRFDAHDGLIIAATNHGDYLDPAIWRRFDIHVELGLPGVAECRRILARYLAPFRMPQQALTELATSCATASPALMRQLCEGLKRNHIIGPRVGWPMDRSAVFERVLASVAPHPDLGKPALWARGTDDRAVAAFPWPLSTDAPEEVRVAVSAAEQAAGVEGSSVVPLRSKKDGRGQ